MDVDAPEVHPLVIMPYVPSPLEDPIVLVIGALARLRIAEHQLKESKVDRDKIQREIYRLQGLQRDGDRDYKAMVDRSREEMLEMERER